MEFRASDSVPAADTRLLTKGPTDTFYRSNYQVYFDPNCLLRSSIFSSEISRGPCGQYTGNWLILDEYQVRAET